MRRVHLGALAAAITLVIATPLFAQDSVLDIARRASEITANATEIVGAETATNVLRVASEAKEQYKEETAEIVSHNEDIYRQGMKLAEEMAGSQMEASRQAGNLPSEQAAPNAKDVKYRIFVSQRMPTEEVRALVQAYADRRDVSIVVRGMLPGQKFLGLQQWVGKVMGKPDPKKPTAGISIDPQPYADLGINRVPAVARYDDNGKLLAFAQGITSTDWIEGQVKRGGRGNLGVHGPTQETAEQDMIELMKRAAEAYDWEGDRATALDRFWKQTEVHSLPRVTAPRVREMDPTFEVARTITAPDGQIIAKAGERINPLKYIVMNDYFLFFNPADPDQVSWAKAQVKANPGRTLTLMATQVRSLGGPDEMGQLADRIGARVFLLNGPIKERFSIERVPTLVRGENARLIIEEHVPPRGAKR